MMTQKNREELQERFCEGCPLPESEKGCPCPRGQKDWYKCNWKATLQETGVWGKNI